MKYILISISAAIISSCNLKEISEREAEMVMEANKRSDIIGKRIIIDGDTSTIIDFNGWNNKYKLYNGRNIDIKFVMDNPKCIIQ